MGRVATVRVSGLHSAHSVLRVERHFLSHSVLLAHDLSSLAMDSSSKNLKKKYLILVCLR